MIINMITCIANTQNFEHGSLFRNMLGRFLAVPVCQKKNPAGIFRQVGY